MIRVSCRRGNFSTELGHDIVQLIQFQRDADDEIQPVNNKSPQPHSAVSGVLLATLSGRAQKDIVVISSLPVVSIQFMSDHSVTDQGFRLEYFIIPQGKNDVIVMGNQNTLSL